MKIKRMTAHFGALDGRTLSLTDGLNILYAPNESGKSTWCAFLRTMLYGLDTAQRSRAGQKPDKLKYRPWNGTPMSGTLELTSAEEGAVTLSRWTERENQPMQMFSATVTGTARPVPGLFADTAGERLTGVPREVFERSAFIRQAGLAMSNDPELDRRITALVTTGSEDVSYLEADRTLHAWLRHRRSGRRGAIPELEAEMAEVRLRLRDLQASEKDAAALEEELSSLEAQRETAVSEMQKARAEQRRQALAELSVTRARTEQARKTVGKAQAGLDEICAELEQTPFGDTEPETARRRAEELCARTDELRRLADKTPPLSLALLPLAAALVSLALMFLTSWRTACAAAAGVFALGTLAALVRLISLGRKKRERLEERRRLLADCGVREPEELEDVLEAWRRLRQRREQADTRLREAQTALAEAGEDRKRAEARLLGDLDFAQGDSPAALAGRRVEELTARIARLREQRAAAEGKARATGDPMVLESTLAELRRRHGELCRQEQALTLAIETMAGADAELQQRFSPKLAAEAAGLFARLTDGRYDEITLARDLTARTRTAGDAVGRESDYLSAGALDQLYLALRLAVCRLVLPGEDLCPIVLDDALVNFDRERLERALKLLRELAEERQILLFTCHEREFDFFADDAAVTRLRL